MPTPTDEKDFQAALAAQNAVRTKLYAALRPVQWRANFLRMTKEEQDKERQMAGLPLDEHQKTQKKEERTSLRELQLLLRASTHPGAITNDGGW